MWIKRVEWRFCETRERQNNNKGTWQINNYLLIDVNVYSVLTLQVLMMALDTSIIGPCESNLYPCVYTVKACISNNMGIQLFNSAVVMVSL